jgi:GNAT superfamily N-acetyltransferase
MTRVAWSPDDEAGLRLTVLEELRRTLGSLTDEIRPVGPGWVARSRSLPLVWSLNQLRITEPITFAAASALADECLAGLPYRHILVEDEPTAARLEGSFRAAGWMVDRDVLMALAEPPDRVVDTGSVVALNEEQMLALMRRWLMEERPDISAAGLDQVEEYNRREGRVWNERRLGIVDRHHGPTAITKLRVHQTTAWVEDVYTVPDARGRGHARALVSHATALAESERCRLTFIVADDNDWPKNLSARVGFRPVGHTTTFHRNLSPVDPSDGDHGDDGEVSPGR